MEMMELSAAAVAQGDVPGSVCVRHGRPAARHVDFVIKSRPVMRRPGALETNLLSMAARMGEYGRRLVVVRAKRWPLCDRCVRIRFAGLLLATVMFWGGLVSVATAVVWRVASDSSVPWLMVPFGGGLLLALASVGPFVWGSLPRLPEPPPLKTACRSL